MSDRLAAFVHRALSAGESRASIREVLLEAHWGRDAVDKALAVYADVSYAVPVPRPRPYVSAREAFVYLLLFSGLYATAISLGSLLFLFVDLAMPDPAVGWLTPQRVLEGIRWSTAWLLISAPLFVGLSWRVQRSLARQPHLRASRIRKWLTYLTLFVACSVLTGDLVTLLFNLLDGELTARFMLKALIVGGIAGATCALLGWDLRQDDRSPAEGNSEATARPAPAFRAGISLAGLALTVAIAVGLWTVGSPGKARAERMDDRRVSHLNSIANAIDAYDDRVGRLPDNLEALSADRNVHLAAIEDPETAQPYEYRVIDDATYQICATFQQAEHSEDRTRLRRGTRFWDHEAGRHCFTVEVEREDDEQQRAETTSHHSD